MRHAYVCGHLHLPVFAGAGLGAAAAGEIGQCWWAASGCLTTAWAAAAAAVVAGAVAAWAVGAVATTAAASVSLVVATPGSRCAFHNHCLRNNALIGADKNKPSLRDAQNLIGCYKATSPDALDSAKVAASIQLTCGDPPASRRQDISGRVCTAELC